MSKPYLVTYNTIQALGWSFLLYQMISYLVTPNRGGSLYDSTRLTLQIFQTGAVLEILHAVCGLVRSSVQVTTQQVFSRVYVVWAILYLCPSSQSSIGFSLLLFAWTITEIIRYSMYAISLIGTPPYFLTWLRYTFFIIAYPVGVSGELFCSYSALLEAQENGIFTVGLPNRLNATFSFPLVILAIMLAYIPLFPPMYMHMFSQRRKVLNVQKED